MMHTTKNKNLTQDLVERIGKLIVKGDVAAGQNLPIEAKLCEMFDSSRTVLREAIKMLTAKGLVGSMPKRGTYVEPEKNWNFLDPDVLEWILQRRFSPTLLKEFLIVRQSIEPTAAVQAISNASPEQIEAIRIALLHMEDAANGDYDPLEADIAFHIKILDASCNRFIQQFAPVVKTALNFSIRMTNQEKGVRIADVSAHAEIYYAIRDKKPSKARKIVYDLLQEAIELTEAVEAKYKLKTATNESISRPPQPL